MKPSGSIGKSLWLIFVLFGLNHLALAVVGPCGWRQMAPAAANDTISPPGISGWAMEMYLPLY